MFEGICEVLHREMDKLDEQLGSGKIQLNDKNLQDIDKIAHALKSIAGYAAMKGNSEYGGSYDGGSYNSYGGSYARGRSRMTGRYISRDGGYNSGYYHEVPNGYER